jgi:stage II sporulation protein D
VQVINRLELEDYLKSVVSSEMPSRWPLEALKAQAVCARTYTLNTLQHKDILQSSVVDQMYLGYDREDDRGRKAVEETNGQVMLDNLGNYVDAYYSSSGGNYTSSVADVWGLSARPYLVPVNDYAHGSSYQSWTRDFSLSDLESKLADLRLSRIESVTVFQRSIEGRATKIQISGKENFDSSIASKLKSDTNGDIFEAINPQAKSKRKPLLATRYLSGEELRHKLSLPSTNFQLTKQDDKYSFRGTGFGHGIGMTQYGAKNMAEDGASYREILNHYYQGVILSEAKDP